MTIDKQKLKALAEAAQAWSGEIGEHRWYEGECFKQPYFGVPDAEYLAAVSPATVLALLEEIDQLRDSHEQVCTNYNRVSFVAGERGEERDQLKAENEALRTLVLSALEEGKGRPGTGGNAPGHCHAVPGIWDRGNGERSGTTCGWCRIWNAAQAMVKEAIRG